VRGHLPRLPHFLPLIDHQNTATTRCFSQKTKQKNFSPPGAFNMNERSILPDHPELRSTFMVLGSDVAKGRNLGVIDMRQIAPSVPTMLGIKLPEARLQPINYKP
jgi:hypothetical protein